MRRDSQKQENALPETVKLGSQLKALREAQGLSYDDVASATHMRPHIIKSIEDGTIEETAAPIYARGFIKTYCEYLMAADLWRKYNLGIPTADEPGEDNAGDEHGPIEIKYPTPIFRRSSIIWVYIILVIAILGAAYLLWRQSVQPESDGEFRFPYQSPYSPDVTENVIYIMPASPDIAEAPEARSISEPVSPDANAPQDRGPIAFGDLSWMNATLASASPIIELPRFIDRTLLIEITGANNRITVEQDGRVVTRRTLGMGSRRSYDVSSDTKITIAAGNKARVTWFGKRFDSIGSDNASISLIFHPDGSVTLVSGNSPHFTRGVASGNG